MKTGNEHGAGEDEEEEEGAVVGEGHAVPDPGTVVVEPIRNTSTQRNGAEKLLPGHADSAHPAVLGAHRPSAVQNRC